MSTISPLHPLMGSVFSFTVKPGSPFLRAKATPTGDQSFLFGPVFARTM